MLTTETYSALQLDALKEVANIGAGHAASALSLMLEECVTISITNVNSSDAESLLSDLLPSDVFSFCHPLSGKLSGEIWVKISKSDADLIALSLS